MSQPVALGCIGVGAFMARTHLPNILKQPGIRLHTLCDLDEALLRRRAAEFRPRAAVTDAEAVFRNPEIDAVLVGTRSRDHAGLLLRAARAGKHVYVEKPMTMTLEETRAVLEAVRASGIRVGVGFNRRYAPAMVEARRRFQGYRRGPANVVYRIVDDHRVRPPYVFDLTEGGGHLLQEGCHVFDLLAWFLEAEPVEVYAAGPLETDNAVIVTYADGSLAVVLCGGKGGVCYPKELMEVFCAARTLVVDHFFELRLDGPGGSLRRTFPVPGAVPPLPEDSMTGFYTASFAARPPEDLVGAHAANHLPTPDVDKGHARALAAFAEALVGGRRFVPDETDGARATVCALKAYESIREHRPVPIEPAEYLPPARPAPGGGR